MLICSLILFLHSKYVHRECLQKQLQTLASCVLESLVLFLPSPFSISTPRTGHFGLTSTISTPGSMKYDRFVEYGRLVLVDAGAHKGELAVITNILNIKTVQIEGPKVPRCIIPVNHIMLSAFSKPTKESIKSADALAICKELIPEFEKSEAGRQLKARSLRANLNDFQRFTALRLNKMRNDKIHELCK